MMEFIKATTQAHFAHLFKIRVKVFVEEQAVSANEEIDDLDETTPLFIAYHEGVPVATARLIFVDQTLAKIGRVAVLKEYRGQGIGKEMLLYLMQYLKQETDVKTVKLGAQCQAIPFYEKLGFEAFGDIYLDANIEHVDMKCQIK